VILVMLAVFATVLVVTSATQQSGSVLDHQSARAYRSARAGAEFGAYQSLVSGAAGCAAANTTFQLEGTLSEFRVTVSCTTTTHNEAGTDVSMFQVTATACTLTAGTCPAATPTAFYVERELRLTVGSN